MLFGEFAQQPPPFLSEPRCVCYRQEAVTEKVIQLRVEKEAKHGWVRNVREQPCSVVHSPANLPAFQSPIQTSESLDKSCLCPPSAGYTLPSLPAPPSLLSLLSILRLPPFSSADPHPRIAQQVPSENRVGDVGRVKLSPTPLSSWCLYLSLLKRLHCFTEFFH